MAAMHLRMFAFALTLASSPSIGQPTKLTIDDPRPVAKAVELLEQKYGWLITYEDPPYIYAGDVKDVTREVARSDPGNDKIIVPRGGSIEIDASVVASKTALLKPLEAVQKILDAETRRRGYPAFRVFSTASMTHVVPTQQSGATGSRETIHPVLDTNVSLSPGKSITATEWMDMFGDELSRASGQKISVNTDLVLNLLNQRMISLGGSGTARSLLVKFLTEISTDKRAPPLSWELFYDPGDKVYLVNLYIPGDLTTK